MACHLLGHHRRTPRPHAQEACGHEHLRIASGQFVARKLFDHELVVGLIRIERTHDVVSIAPSIGTLVVVRIPSCVGVARDIKPMASPLLAIVRACQQPVDQSLPSTRSGVGKEGMSLLGGGWQPCQVEYRATQQIPPVGTRCGLYSGLGQPDQVKGVNRVRGGDLRNLGLADRLKRPDVLWFVEPLGPIFRLPSGSSHSHSSRRAISCGDLAHLLIAQPGSS